MTRPRLAVCPHCHGPLPTDFRQKLTEHMVRTMQIMRDNGASYQEIGYAFGVHHSTVMERLGGGTPKRLRRHAA